MKELILKNVFHGDFERCLYKSLFRMTDGSRSKSFDIIRKTLTHYTDEVLTDFELDCILGELNGGVEIEWETD